MLIPMGVYEVPAQAKGLRKAVNCANQALEVALNSSKTQNGIEIYDAPVELDFFVMECVCKMLRKRIDEGKKSCRSPAISPVCILNN